MYKKLRHFSLAIAAVCASTQLFAQVSAYTVAATAGTYTPITGGTVLYSGTFDDGLSTAITIPSFSYNCTPYTSLKVNANGHIALGTYTSSTNYTPLSGVVNASGGLVSAMGRDLASAATGAPEIRYELVGNEFVVQWKDVRRSGTPSEVLNFQIRLNTSTNAIAFVYGTCTPGANTIYPEIGLKGVNNTFATNIKNITLACGATGWLGATAGTANNSTVCLSAATLPASGTTFTWSAPGAPAAPASITGASELCDGAGPQTYSVTANASATTYTWTVPVGWSLMAGANTNSITVMPGAVGSGVITVSLGNACGTSGATSLSVTINPVATVNAGVNQSVCSNGAVSLSGIIAGGATSATWSGGTGTFTPSFTTLNASYTPSAADIAGGTVTLTLTSNDPTGPCSALSDNVTIDFFTSSTVNAGVDQVICAGSSVSLSGTYGASAATAVWSSSGSGTFTSTTTAAGTVTSTYNPSPTDVTAGAVTLTLTTNDPSGPCGPVSDAMVVTINPAVVVNAGVDQDICSNGTVSLSGNIGGGATTATWTTSGTGTFSNPSLLNTTYSPSAADINLGNVSLTLTTTNPAGSCSIATDEMILTINPAATVNAGADQSVCVGTNTTVSLAGVISGGSNSGIWTAPTGSFNNPALLNAIYTPVANAGSVVLTLTSNDPSGPCSAQSDVVTINLIPNPTVDAGNDTTVCSNHFPLTLTATGTGNSYSWSNGSSTATTTVTAGGTYTVTATLNGCTAQDAITVVEDPCLGVEEPSLISRVYPNPSNAQVTIELQQAEEVPYTVFSADGKRTASGTIKNGKAQLDVSTFAPGKYMVRVLQYSTSFEVMH